MNKILTSLIAMILLVVSFFLGTAFNTYNIATETIRDLNQLTELWLDDEIQTSRLIRLYKTYLEQPEEVPNLLRWSILANYDSGQFCKGQYCDELGLSYRTLRTNELIIDFLNDFPMLECSELEPKQRVECNLKLLR